MMAAILILLIAADLALVYAFMRLSKKQQVHQKMMLHLNEERSMLSELRSEIRDDITTARTELRAIKEQVQVIAMEAEQEVRQGMQSMTGEVEQMMGHLAERLDGPLNAVTDKQHYVENLLQRLHREKVQLARLTNRAAQLTKFFKEDLPYEEVLKDLENKKFSDIRALIVQGVKPEKIARELSVSEQEVRLVAGLNP